MLVCEQTVGKGSMGNVTLPTPVALAGGAFCVLGGYLIGVVAGPDSPSRTTAVVESYDSSGSRLCLTGESIKDQAGVSEDGLLCGTWRRPAGSRDNPVPGEEFRFVSVVSRESTADNPDAPGTATVIYGDVLP
jgi:hypothetical protein